ncbi:MAG: hypothetical protein A3C79_01855 [Candidatus Taylorbacteria bacterium RIFCSPHIGHO2_02_FULL_45_28]|uniref:Uncharacterized protein n=1 Tax=Candidatus Taylorbacteria bacterium RIFCSPHIGHO2_12_FULL_45_16 TaxID=1802315 RepID=A0A1G2N026_9BACT|nr:MAG: hypothetical protein A2830_02660 [Candidatus Taylorbacteria bacterium RIFCSPHIGHO2_01_FULL_44_110]OHA25194.1 MAG: hypothetical protein A3C79_01855 [Candidatus Taylorbacteria bacterium RIFCSPHIGHO2_02_FULL_45_28]OHA29438.1 MAG: hypothetical protein A3F51_00165 [Candidatus Taylorbacteria bacterium RIFCSPHIGHO2_12_FULL_45_16]OHA33200.1 MAG: hypothetical protein A3A23_02695 [Candidatus Taylorbacteria bacterium RIFCSPLOWO2_01_FULL_45_59]OHA38254.1 MAG: hypothetical protein A3I98_02960 [Candi
MNTKTLTNRAISVVDQYLNFKVGTAVCSVPYFNNKTVKIRAALAVNGGKGGPKEIFEETEALLVKVHATIDSVTSESLQKLLTDNNLGIDCSAFAYYVLNAESQELGKGSLDKHTIFVNCHGLIGKLRCSLRPIENCDVSTLAHDKNSRVISIKEITPGDIITMLGDGDIQILPNDRDHILVIHQVEYQNFIPYRLHYSHAVAYPEDGIYGTGIKQGIIEITDVSKQITEQLWTENGRQGNANRIFGRAQKSKTEIRRLRWLK